MIRRDFQRLLSSLVLASAGVTAAETGTPAEASPRRKKVAVIGAGLAGLAAARALQQQGHEVVVIEGRERIGGRIWTSDRWAGMPLDLGATWIHGVQGNPLTALADRLGAARLSTRYERSITVTAEGQALSAQQEARLDTLTAQLKRSLVRAQSRDPDVSVLQAVTPLLDTGENPAQTRQWIDFILNSDLEHEYGGSAAELSAHWFDDSTEFDGGDELFAQGFGVITAALAQGLNIQTGHIVQHIHWAASPVRIVTQAGEFTADQVVMTLPLGVLKAQRVGFTPALPPDKQSAIARLGMGLLNKCYLRFEKPFWPTDVDWIGHIAAEPGAWTQWVSFMRAARQPVLLGFHAAQRARQIEAWTDQQTGADAMKTLRRLFGQHIPDPVDHQITRWAGDPFALGSYSFNALGSRPQMRRDLARPLAGRLFFAGEATEKDHFGTAHGALLSGERAAREVLGT